MIKETLTTIGTGVVDSMEKHSPEICIGMGIVSLVACTIFACKGTIKAKEALEEAEDNLDTIERAKENKEKINYSDEEYKKDKLTVLSNVGGELIRSYGPALILGITGIGLIVKGHNILQKRNVALIAAYEGVSAEYRKYREKTKKLLGEDVATNLKWALEEKEIEADTGKKNKDGTPKTKKEKILAISRPNDFSPYARIYDSCCPGW